MVKLDTTLTINIDSLLKDLLKQEAERNNVSLSWIIRKYIMESFEDTQLGHYYRSQLRAMKIQKNGGEH